MGKRILTGTVSLPLTRPASRVGPSRSCWRTSITSIHYQLEVLRKSSHELISHRAQSGEVGDIILVESAVGEHRVVASEEDIWLD
jgi:hypothetical protein